MSRKKKERKLTDEDLDAIELEVILEFRRDVYGGYPNSALPLLGLPPVRGTKALL